MRKQARAVVQMARATDTRNDENKADTVRRAKMACRDWQARRQIKKPGQARGHRPERQEGRLAKGQAAQSSRRPCVTGTDAAGQLEGGAVGMAGRSTKESLFPGQTVVAVSWGRGRYALARVPLGVPFCERWVFGKAPALVARNTCAAGYFGVRSRKNRLP
jgi:hypothetical protein